MLMDEMTWRRLPTSAAPANLQLAAGDALLVELDELQQRQPALRWYGIEPAALILGSGQQIGICDRDACVAAGIALHRRASGGTTVLAEPDQIMLDIALPKGHPLYRHDVTESYRWLGDVWAVALEELGLPAHVITVDEARADYQTLDALTRRACFAGRSPYEVLVEGRKLVGLAQVRRRAGALLQAGIYTDLRPERLPNLLALTPTERATLTERLTTRMVGLADLLPVHRKHRGLALPVLMKAFATALAGSYGYRLERTGWSAAALAARTRSAPRYAALEIG